MNIISSGSIRSVLIAVLFCFLNSAALADKKGDTPTKGADFLAPVVPHVFKGDLRALPKARQWQPGDPIKDIPKRRRPPEIPLDYDPRIHRLDPLLEQQKNVPHAELDQAMSVPLLNQDGQGYTGLNPPDTMGDVGSAYYIQMVNASGGSEFTVYDKTDGSVVAGPMLLDSLGSGVCANGLGDPVVLYDELAGRWMLSEFSTQANDTLCVYISKTSDPITGGWYNYAFTAANGFPDYPKYSVWPDAYYITSNESVPTIYALDRAQMLTGAAATLQSFTAAGLSGFGFQALTPADHDGTLTPPLSSPGYFIRHRDTEVHGAGSCIDSGTMDCLEIFEFSVNWSTPGNSTFSMVQTVPVAEFDSHLCGLTSFTCFAQPGSSTALDPLREVVMWRLQYRNMGTHEVLVGNFVTDVDGTDRGGIRWFELRKSAMSDWSLEQEGTYSPDSSNRWMGAISMDGSGNIALAYNISSDSVFPGIRYAGRLAADPPGTLPQGENTLVSGSAANSSNRYGDYSSMSVDPVDQCTFWFTGEYNANSQWSTRIGAFKFDTCTGTLEPDFTLSSPSDLAPAVCAGDPLPDIVIDVGSIGGFADPVDLAHIGLADGFVDLGFTTTPVTPPGSSVASVTVGAGVTAGPYSYEIEGQGPADTHSLMLDATVFDGLPVASNLLSPPDSATGQSSYPVFVWSSVIQGASYFIEIATDNAFANIVDSAIVNVATYTPAIALSPSAEYFWRITASNACGTGAVSAVFRFTTSSVLIAEYCTAPVVDIPDNNPTGLTDTLTVPFAGAVSDLDVSIRVTHTWMGDLDFTLTSPAGTSVKVVDRVCSGDDDLDVTLDDDATNGVVGTACPQIDGLDYTPSNPLSPFNGKEAQGDWQMKVVDNEGQDTGTLDHWCIAVETSVPPIDCDGADVTLANASIPPGQTVTCNVGDILVQDLLLGGNLIINKYGDLQLQTPIDVLNGGKLQVNEVAPP